MPKPAPAARLSYKTYQHLLKVLVDNAMIIAGRIGDELKPAMQASPAAMDLSTITRNFVIVSGFVRRSIVVSRYIATLPVPTEEREHRLGPALDRVLRLFSARKMTIEEYNRAIDKEIDGEHEAEFEAARLEQDELDEVERAYDPDGDVPGRPPVSLVAELCRDFGMIAHAVPAEWLEPVPTELRLLCARAAAASIRPSVKSARIGRALQR